MNASLVSLLVALACAPASPQGELAPAGGPKLVIPKDIWEPIFFESINRRARQSELSDLRKVVLPPGDLEVRLWEGFGLSKLEGYVLKRKGGRWQAIWLQPALPRFAKGKYMRSLGKPKSGWERLWGDLTEHGLLTLPDSSELKEERLILDGTSYVVEINREGVYRTYQYGNPDLQRWPQAKQMLAIVGVIDREFDMHDKRNPERRPELQRGAASVARPPSGK